MALLEIYTANLRYTWHYSRYTRQIKGIHHFLRAINISESLGFLTQIKGYWGFSRKYTETQRYLGFYAHFHAEIGDPVLKIEIFLQSRNCQESLVSYFLGHSLLFSPIFNNNLGFLTQIYHTSYFNWGFSRKYGQIGDLSLLFTCFFRRKTTSFWEEVSFFVEKLTRNLLFS